MEPVIFYVVGMAIGFVVGRYGKLIGEAKIKRLWARLSSIYPFGDPSPGRAAEALPFYTVPAKGDVYTTPPDEFNYGGGIEAVIKPSQIEGATYDKARLELARHMAERAARLRDGT